MEADRLLSLAVAVAAERTVHGVIQTIVQGLATHPSVALARIWLHLPCDMCDSSFMRGDCRDRTQCFHLAASAGTPVDSPGEDWSYLQGRFRRIPMNTFKVRLVGATGTALLFEDVASEREHIARPEWVRREGIRSFAGHPLITRDKVLGVLATFTREPLDEQTFAWLGMFANQAAVAIANARANEELDRLRSNWSWSTPSAAVPSTNVAVTHCKTDRPRTATGATTPGMPCAKETCRQERRSKRQSTSWRDTR